MKRSRVRGIWGAGAVARLSGWLGEAFEVRVEGGSDSVMFLSIVGKSSSDKEKFQNKVPSVGACLCVLEPPGGWYGWSGRAEAAGGMIGCRGQR